VDERQSAEIIQFPPPRVNNVGRVPAPLPPAPEVEASPDLARARLMLALASLEAALAGQRKAVAGWRGSIGELRGSLADLGGSMQLYRQRLGELGTEVTTLNVQAQNLGEWAADR